MNVALFDVLTDTTLREDKALEQNLINKASSGTPWLVKELPNN